MAVLIGGFTYWTAFHSTNQTVVQRYMSLPNIKKARFAIFIFIIGIMLIISLCCYSGLLIYAKYWKCDPQTIGLIDRDDQLFPLYVMETVGMWKGVAGLFIAGIVGGALSTLSVILNSVAGVLLEDILKGCLKKKPSEMFANIFVKSSIAILGAATIALLFVVEKLGGVLSVTASLASIVVGTNFSVISLGMLNPYATSKGAFFGIVAGCLSSGWISLGSQIAAANGKVVQEKMWVSVEECPVHNFTGPIFHDVPDQSDVFPLYRLSYHWITPIGILTVFIVGSIVSYLTGPQNLDSVDPELISPVIYKFLPKESFINFGMTSKNRQAKKNVKLTVSNFFKGNEKR